MPTCSRHQFSCCIPQAGWRAGSPHPTRSSSWMWTSSARCMCSPRASTSARMPGARRLREVPPGGHFLGCAHTQSNFETAFYRSSIADNNSYEQWLAEGSMDAPQRANRIWKRMLNEYEAPPIDPGIDEALREYIEKRRRACGCAVVVGHSGRTEVRPGPHGRSNRCGSRVSLCFARERTIT